MSTQSLTERISADLTKSMKAGEKLKTETLRTILAGLKEKLVERRPAGGMTPDDELAVLMQAAKRRREAADIFAREGRTDLSTQEEAELLIIQAYLPKAMTEGELRTIIASIVAAAGAKGPGDFGKVMPLVMKEVKGKIDGKLVHSNVKSILEGSANGTA
jgi:uncharacterized protein YqeY